MVNYICIDNCENINNDQVFFEGVRVFLNDIYEIKNKFYNVFLILLLCDVVVNVNNIFLEKDYRNEVYLVFFVDKVNFIVLYEEYIMFGGYLNWYQFGFYVNRIYFGF